MTDRPFDAPPPPPPVPTVTRSALVGDILGVLTAPDTAIPRVVRQPGFMFAGIIAGAFVVIGTLTFLFGTRAGVGAWPSFPSVMREFLGLAVLAAGLAGLVFVLASALLKRPGITIEHAANAVAVMLIPWILLDVVLFILSPFPDVTVYISPLEGLIPVLFLMAAVQGGLGCRLGESLLVTIVAVFVAMLVYDLIAMSPGEAAMAGAVADFNRAMQQWGVPPR